MLYQSFQAYSDMAGPVRGLADLAAAALAHPLPGMSPNAFHRAGAAICELVAHARLSHHRPAFGIDTVEIGALLANVRETAPP
jgi:poly(3-hydroxybutyrate) depolymerase